MKTFEYTAVDASAQPISGSARAESELALDRELEARGLTLTRAKAVLVPRAARRHHLPVDDLLHLTTQLATLTSARVPLVEGLVGIALRAESPRLRALLDCMVVRLRQGASLSGAMADHPGVFPSVYLASVRAGEASGALHAVLARLGRYLQWSRTLRAATFQIAFYPLVCLAALVGLVLVLVYYLLPRILRLFPQGVVDLPPETRMVAALTGFLHSNAGPLALVAAALGLLLFWALRSPGARNRMQRAALSLPRIGTIARQIATSKFASTASTLQAAGCDAFTVLELSGSACGNAALEATFARVSQRVRRGTGLSESMGEEPLIDPLLVQLVSVGEQSGRLDECLDRLVEHYDEEVPRAVKRFLAWLEPAVLFTAGAIVTFVLLAALMPIFQLYENIG